MTTTYGTAAGPDLREQRKAVVREFYRIKNERDYDRLKDVFVEDFSADFVRHYGAAEPFDIDKLAKKYWEYVQSFPDLHYDVVNLVAEGDWVVARLYYRGTHLGPIANGTVPPTGRTIEVHQHLSFRFDGLRIAAMHSTADFLGGMWMRLGIQPPDPMSV